MSAAGWSGRNVKGRPVGARLEHAAPSVASPPLASGKQECNGSSGCVEQPGSVCPISAESLLGCLAFSNPWGPASSLRRGCDLDTVANGFHPAGSLAPRMPHRSLSRPCQRAASLRFSRRSRIVRPATNGSQLPLSRTSGPMTFSNLSQDEAGVAEEVFQVVQKTSRKRQLDVTRVGQRAWPRAYLKEWATGRGALLLRPRFLPTDQRTLRSTTASFQFQGDAFDHYRVHRKGPGARRNPMGFIPSPTAVFAPRLRPGITPLGPSPSPALLDFGNPERGSPLHPTVFHLLDRRKALARKNPLARSTRR